MPCYISEVNFVVCELLVWRLAAREKPFPYFFLILFAILFIALQLPARFSLKSANLIIVVRKTAVWRCKFYIWEEENKWHSEEETWGKMKKIVHIGSFISLFLNEKIQHEKKRIEE